MVLDSDSAFDERISALCRELGSRGRAGLATSDAPPRPDRGSSAMIDGDAEAAVAQLSSQAPGSTEKQLIQELTELKIGALSRRAMAAGVDADALDLAEESADPRGAIIDLMLQATISAEDPAIATLRVELSALKLGALTRRAVTEGVPAQELDDTEDTEDPKEALIELLLKRASASTSAARS